MEYNFDIDIAKKHGVNVLRELWKEKDDMFFLCGFAE
jgi:hypothetical protein